MADNAAVRAKLQAYLLLNQEEKGVKARKEALKAELMPYLKASEVNSRGSHSLALESPVEVQGERYKGLQYTRKESTVLNEERALEFLLSDAAFEVAVDTVHHVNQDGLWGLLVEDFITQEQFDSFFDTTVSWAFQPIKE